MPATNRVMIDASQIQRGIDESNRRRRQNAAEEYAQNGQYDQAADETFTSDPELSNRFRQRGQESASEAYRRDVAPLIAEGTTDSMNRAITVAGKHGRPEEDIAGLRAHLQAADERQLQEVERQTQQVARTLLGIAEMAPDQQQAAYTQWRSTLPPEAQARVPEAYSEGYVRRRMREAQTIQQIITDQANERRFNLQERSLELTEQQRGETERHNRAMESAAAARAAATSQRRRPYTEFAATSAAFANRASAADDTILSLGNNVDWNDVWGAGAMGLSGNESTRRARQAMREFINVRNRRESGAAVSNAEWLSARIELFPAVGDPPSVIRQKAEARARVIRGLIVGSQGAAQEMYPEMFDEGARWADLGGAAADVDYSEDGEGGSDIPQAAIDLLTQNPTPENRAYFDQTFGEGAAAEILGR